MHCAGNPCVAAKQKGDALISAVSQRTRRLIGQDIVTTGKQPGDFGPQLRPSDWTYCQNQAADMGAIVRRYNKYRDALPYARAANDVNELKDNPGSASKGATCLTRLPDTAPELNKALGLPPGTIKDADLRNDTTGFRAAMYRDESTAPPKLILVPRDTEAHSLVDWRANTDNGQSQDSDQYSEMRNLSGKLAMGGVRYDLAGYSKGGGMAQEGALMASPDSKVYVFNSAGLADASLSRTGNSSFDSLASRTTAFSADGDFLTYMNNTTDPNQQIANARFLREQLAKSGNWLWQPIGIQYRNPAMLAGQQQQEQAQLLLSQYVEAGVPPPDGLMSKAGKDVDPTFQQDKQTYLTELDKMVASAEQKRSAGVPFQLFPPVRANDQETVPDSMSLILKKAGAGDPSANIARLYQHQMSCVLDPMEKVVEKDEKALTKFKNRCP